MNNKSHEPSSSPQDSPEVLNPFKGRDPEVLGVGDPQPPIQSTPPPRDGDGDDDEQ